MPLFQFGVELLGLRVGFAVANPITTSEAVNYPFSILTGPIGALGVEAEEAPAQEAPTKGGRA